MELIQISGIHILITSSRYSHDSRIHFYTTTSPYVFDLGKLKQSLLGLPIMRTHKIITLTNTFVIVALICNYWKCKCTLMPQYRPKHFSCFAYFILCQMHYTSENVVEGKNAAKRALQQRFGLQQTDVPIVGIITRLTAQKGIHLIKHALHRTLERNGQVNHLMTIF